MRPVLCELTPPIHQIVQHLPPILTEARVQHHVVCGQQNIDEIKLQQPQPVDDTSNVRVCHTRGTRLMKTLSGDRDTASFRKAQPERHLSTVNSVDQAMPDREPHQLSGAMQVQLLHHTAAMSLHRIDAQF
jgi:hypothetical protein